MSRWSRGICQKEANTLAQRLLPHPERPVIRTPLGSWRPTDFPALRRTSDLFLNQSWRFSNPPMSSRAGRLITRLRIPDFLINCPFSSITASINEESTVVLPIRALLKARATWSRERPRADFTNRSFNSGVRDSVNLEAWGLEA